MECYLCQSSKNLSRYMVDGATTIFVCQECEEELLVENHLEIEDKIYDQSIYDISEQISSYACA